MTRSTAALNAYTLVQPATAIASHRVLPDKVAEYCEAQAAMTEAARKFPGFVGTEVLSPVAGLQEEWVAIFRLESNQAMQRWLTSPERASLAARVEWCLAEPSHLQVLASDDQAEPPVAMVFTHRVRSDKVDAYRAWRQKTIAAQAKYPGYLATDSFEPQGRFQWIGKIKAFLRRHPGRTQTVRVAVGVAGYTLRPAAAWARESASKVDPRAWSELAQSFAIPPPLSPAGIPPESPLVILPYPVLRRVSSTSGSSAARKTRSA